MKKNIWHNKKKFFFLLLYISDIFAFILSAIISSKIIDINLQDPFYIRYFLFALLIIIFTYSNYKLYDDKRNFFDDTDFTNIIYSNIITFSILFIFILIFNPRDLFLLSITLITLFFAIIFTTIARILLNKLIYFAREKGYDIKQTVFFGEQDNDLINKLKEKHLGYNLVKVINDRVMLKQYLEKEKNVDIIFMKMSSVDEDMLELITKYDYINWKIISSILNLVIEPVAFDEFKDYPIINISNKNGTNNYLKIKRLMDILLSGIALIVLSPLFLIIIILIKIYMPGPIFFSQERLGKELKPFKLYKFRSMKVNADNEKIKLKNEVNGLFKMKNDPRITPLGRILRRTGIDELPQLLNILLGEMSIVGPRPHLKNELSNFQGWRMARFNVKPGLTGMWQVNGRHDLNFDKAVLYDVYYAKHMSLILDLSIILKTIPAIIMNSGKF